MSKPFQATVLRRVRLREELKPVKAYSGDPAPDWVLITRIADQKGFESFELQLLKSLPPASGCPARTFCTATRPYDTLRIAKAQAHADLGVEYVEWEPCNIVITDEDGSINWSRALPLVEQAA